MKEIRLITDENIQQIVRLVDFHDGEGLIVDRLMDCIACYDRYNENPYSINTFYLYYDTLEMFSKDENSVVFQYDTISIVSVFLYLKENDYSVPNLKSTTND